MNTNRLCVCACVMALLGCQRDANTPCGSDGIDDHQGRVIRYLALGDSYTIGEAVTPSARWPNQLVDALRPSLQDRDSLAAMPWRRGRSVSKPTPGRRVEPATQSCPAASRLARCVEASAYEHVVRKP